MRVIAKIDNSRRIVLSGHLPGALRRAKDLGRLSSSTPVEHMIMVLQPSDEQKAELRRVLDEQQDSRAANYHQWMTPEQFGASFGVADDDIAQVSAWLESQGFTVDDVAKSKRVLHFSGTIGNLETAFHTQMHSYQVNGETHVSNNSAISVPAALNPVIAAVPMNNFFRKGHMGPVRTLRALISSPDFTSGTTHYTGPADFAAIYNTAPLLAAGINGTGSSIAVVGRSDIQLSDVQTYRQLFGLPPNDPIFIHAGQDNGTEPGDDGESDLDVEISGGIAPNAQIYFVIGTPTYLVDGITNSIQYIVENNLADIMSISYGSCEGVEGTGGNAFNSQAFEQAAAQGISVFVASGDNGPAECDNQNDSYEVLGYAAGSEASTPYSVAVGGSEFNEGSGTYWATSNTAQNYGSALRYIPEYPWNSAKGATPTTESSLSGLWSGSGGISSYYLQPSWQTGPGINNSSDPAMTNGGDWVTGVTLTNGGGSGYTAAPTVTFTGGCAAEPTATTTISGGSVTGIVFNYGTQGGTLHTGQGIGCTTAPSVAFSAAPACGTTATGTATIGPMWNTPPLISGVPHRLTPDLVLNAASGHDGTLFCSEGVCEISSTGTLLDAGIVGGTSVAAPSMAGIQALINQANGGRQGAPNYIYYSLAAAQNTTNCNSSTPPATGSNCAFQDITQGNNLVCGTSTCTTTTGTKMGWQAGPGYDLATGLGSVNAANLSNQWKNVVFNSSSTTLNLSQTTGILQGGSVTLSGTVAAGSGSGTPTGDVAFILSKGAFGQVVDVNVGGWSGSGTGAYTTSAAAVITRPSATCLPEHIPSPRATAAIRLTAQAFRRR
jgi:subtilase family serine protease